MARTPARAQLRRRLGERGQTGARRASLYMLYAAAIAEKTAREGEDRPHRSGQGSGNGLARASLRARCMTGHLA